VGSVVGHQSQRRHSGLSTEWKVDEADKTKWTFKLRPGVTFHDGSAFNADAVVWNVDKVLKQDVDDAAFLYVAHDVGPRAMSPRIKGFVQPKSWFVDFSPVTITP
jgi:hypothetical protein